jgi:hypothetical protein
MMDMVEEVLVVLVVVVVVGNRGIMLIRGLVWRDRCAVSDVVRWCYEATRLRD